MTNKFHPLGNIHPLDKVIESIEVKKAVGNKRTFIDRYETQISYKKGELTLIAQKNRFSFFKPRYVARAEFDSDIEGPDVLSPKLMYLVMKSIYDKKTSKSF